LSEEETRRLLKMRDDLVARIARLQGEMGDLRKALTAIDRLIARQGFRQPTQEMIEDEEEWRSITSVKSKDGTVLGSLQIEENEIRFVPREDLDFSTSIPPFQSFLIERVFENMRSSDEARTADGEIAPEQVLSYDVITEGDKIMSLNVTNHGGERRLREIRSSLRWTFDKMFEKLLQT
jgi:hypothetical protein